MTTPFYANQSLSHGTMRNVDLLDTLGAALVRASESGHCRFDRAKHHEDLGTEAIGLAERMNEEPDNDSLEESASEIVHEMFDALNDYRPFGCYFEAHPGDGADYGFWEVESDA